MFTPTADDLRWAHEVADAATRAEQSGGSALQLPSGELVDVAAARRAEALLALQCHLAAPGDGAPA